jgi:hypothetical protein
MPTIIAYGHRILFIISANFRFSVSVWAGIVRDIVVVPFP